MPLRDVRSQDQTVTALRAAWVAGKLHHATLLSGPSGVGKTLIANEVARLLLCDSPADGPDACGGCKSCGLIDRQAHPDLLTVGVQEGKKRIAVSTIRELRGLLDYPPHRARARAVVFEQAELMSIEAQNALLKTLEEPSKSNYLLLTTAHSSRLLPTVRSRCSELHLSPLPGPTVVELLREAMPDIDERRIKLAASLSAGSLTAARSLAEADLIELGETVERLDRGIEAESVPDVLVLAEELASDRGNLLTALQLIALWYRDVMLAASGAANVENAVDLPLAFDHKRDEIARRAEKIGVMGASGFLDATLHAVDAISTKNANPRLTVEAMVLRMLA